MKRSLEKLKGYSIKALDAIKGSVKDFLDPSTPINEKYEKHLYDYYGRPVRATNKVLNFRFYYPLK